MATLQMYFLGSLRICSGGRQLPNPPTQKSQSLLAYLVIHRKHPQSRDRLAGLFFGERPDRRARRCLSTALWHIRRCLPDESLLLNDSRTIQFAPHSDLWIDLEEFEELASQNNINNLQTAIDLFRGDFLDGFYDEWILSERYRLEALYLEALGRLMVLYEASKDFRAALMAALRLLSRDALREDAHRLAMRAYCQLGQRKAALEQYFRCRDSMLKEMNAQPVTETTELYQAIMDGQFPVSPLHEVSLREPSVFEFPGQSPLDVVASIRLVGREQELVFLADCWQSAHANPTSLVLISGEVGVGKTRLIEEFANRLRWQGTTVLWGRCYEFERVLPYQPITDAIRNVLPTLSNDALEEFPDWILREVARLVPEVLERPGRDDAHLHRHRKSAVPTGPEPAAAPGTDPEQARLFEGLTRFLAELACQGMILIVLEDLHWAGESSLQLLHHLARNLSACPVLIIGTFRPEAIDQQHHLPILYRQLSREGIAKKLDLERLTSASVIAIVTEMSGAGEAVRLLAERLFRETEGNPFFLMESVKSLFETNMVQLKEGIWQGYFDQLSEMELPMPANLSEAVQARAQRLGNIAQEALRLTAVFGRVFDFEPLVAAWGKGEEAALEGLEELLRRKLIEEQCGPHDRDFAFTHHKIQEVIYQAIPRHRRCYLHAQVGAAIETCDATELDTRASELAYHFEKACLLDRSLSSKAVHYLLKAGQYAAHQSANQEAISYYQRGLGILHSLPETEAHMQQEVELQIALAVPITVIKGYASPEVRRIYDRARELCLVLGNAPDLFTSMAGLVRYYGVSGEPEMAAQLGKQLLSIAQTTQDTDLLVEAYRQMGGILFGLGELIESRKMWRAALTLYNPARHAYLANRFGHDPAVTCLGFQGTTLWMLGYPDQARQQVERLNSLLPLLTHPASQAYAYCHLAKQACIRHQPHTAHNFAESALQICQQQGLAFWNVLATAFKGWALCEQEQAEEGWALLAKGVESWRARGLVHWLPYLLSLQAEAALKMGMFSDGINAVAAALEIGQQKSDRYWLPEVHRLGGELLRAHGAGGSIVEEHFQLALETARQQESRMLELRAAISLARFWRDQGLTQAARHRLAEVYGWFTEGFDTSDLIVAHKLLRELE